jgi:hypothetical protein
MSQMQNIHFHCIDHNGFIESLTSRTLPVKDGVFVDDFKPYEVHVYEW